MPDKKPGLLEIVETKIAESIAEFRDEDVSPERFNVVYRRYYQQLILAYVARTEEMKGTSQDSATFRIDEAKVSKCIGLALYHHKSEAFLDAPGNFDLSSDLTSSIVKELAESAKSAPQVKQLDDERWIVVFTEGVTTAILLFADKPGQFAVTLFSRVMQDFIRANQHLLDQDELDSRKLAQPFTVIIKA